MANMDLSWCMFTSILSEWPFLLLRLLLPQQFLEEVQPSDEVNKSWRIHLRIAFDRVLRSDMNGFGFQLPALLCLWTLNFFPCQGKFSITKTPLIFLFSLFFCFPLLHFSHELQCLIKCEHSLLHYSYLCLAKEKMSLLLFPCMCLQTSH